MFYMYNIAWTLFSTNPLTIVEKFVIYVYVLLQPLRWRCVDCVIHHEWDVREEQKYTCVVWASNNKRDCDTWYLLLLAATVWSFAHMPLGISDCNKIFYRRDAGWHTV